MGRYGRFAHAAFTGENLKSGVCEWVICLRRDMNGAGAYEHDVLDIVEGHSSCWMRSILYVV